MNMRPRPLVVFHLEFASQVAHFWQGISVAPCPAGFFGSKNRFQTPIFLVVRYVFETILGHELRV